MKLHRSLTIILLFFIIACSNKTKTKNKSNSDITEVKDSTSVVSKKDSVQTEEEVFKLNEDNAIPFFYKYSEENPENKVRITTEFGSFVIKLFEETPYHRANFIFLTKSGYYNTTYFHRVVPNFIIQGGNADNKATASKRGEIGRYLLPPDTKKGFKHHRGTVSMPSSDVDNPHKMASPYEFFIVVKKPGSYHLDGEYTAFGKVVEGMDVVDKINSQPIDDGEWPVSNIRIKAEIIN